MIWLIMLMRRFAFFSLLVTIMMRRDGSWPMIHAALAQMRCTLFPWLHRLSVMGTTRRR